MHQHAQEALDLVQHATRDDLDSHRLLNLSLARLLEILGEAANRVPKTTQQQYPEIPWAEIISLRNRLIHGYDAVDFDILWKIVTKDLPSLVTKLDHILLRDYGRD